MLRYLQATQERRVSEFKERAAWLEVNCWSEVLFERNNPNRKATTLCAEQWATWLRRITGLDYAFLQNQSPYCLDQVIVVRLLTSSCFLEWKHFVAACQGVRCSTARGMTSRVGNWLSRTSAWQGKKVYPPQQIQCSRGHLKVEWQRLRQQITWDISNAYAVLFVAIRGVIAEVQQVLLAHMSYLLAWFHSHDVLERVMC